MNTTISSFNSKHIQLSVPYKNKEFLFCFIYLKLKENIYNKLEFLESISKNQHMLDVFKDAIFLSHSSHYNIIQIFIEDKDFNIVINEKLVRFLIIFFDNHSYDLLSKTVNYVLDNYIIKSQYLEASTTNDIHFQKKERNLINLTYFLIEMFNKKFMDSEPSEHRTFVINKIIYMLDIGIINFYEELEMRRNELRVVRGEILIAVSDNELDILTSEKKDLLKRRLYLNKIIGRLYYSIEQFIDFLITDFYKIQNKDIYNIIYVYKKNNPFFYKNIFNFITFSKLIMRALSTHNYQFIIDFSNFYFDLCIKTHNNIFIKEISTSPFIGSIFELAYNVSKTDIDLELFLFSISKIINRIEDYKPILNRINIVLIKKISYVLLDKLKGVYVNDTRLYKTEKCILFIDCLEKINKNILLSYEIRNIYIENIFYIFDTIFKKKEIEVTKKYIATRINIIIVELITMHYNSILNYFSSDINTLCKESWNNYISYFGHKNYLITQFYETVRNQLEFNSNQKHTKDPICNSIIEYPVKIPETEIYMDRYIISRCLMEKEENPFNRNKLTIVEINNLIFKSKNNNKKKIDFKK